ncbi:PREDICTED: furin [Myotis brandtii]|uniref:furin n=1 Tax=Myotis brandtii TaxID=109478 RepID=UPI000704233D|nr:PREDICTED: furin [Myotis brandtii]
MELRPWLLWVIAAAGPLVLLVADAHGQQVFTNTWAVHISGGPAVADRLARKHGFLNQGQIFGDYYHFWHRAVTKRSLSPHRLRHSRLQREPQVQWLEQQVAKRRTKRDLYLEPTDPKFPQQWYLSGVTQRDLNVKEAWAQGYTGRGIVVSILDDGIEKNHPDLAGNYDPGASFDVNDQDPDPQPRYTQMNDNRHGTRCAGEVAAVANNGVCGVGVAYNARIGGVRMLDGEVTDAVEARSLGLNPNHIHIYSASWGPEDDGKTVDGPAPLTRQAFENGQPGEGRGGLGSIFVWASGNGGREHDSCNCDGYTNSIYTLSISSATQLGNVPWYSEACSSTLATTYSSGNQNEKQIVSRPWARGSGLLASSAQTHLPPTRTRLVTQWLLHRGVGVGGLSETLGGRGAPEKCRLSLKTIVLHLAIHLVSPMGTRSTLLAARPHDYSADGFNDWAFMTTHSWDENPSGEWVLEIENTSEANNYGTLTKFTLVLYGTAPEGLPTPPESSGCKMLTSSQACVVCEEGFSLHEKSCVQHCPAGFAPQVLSTHYSTENDGLLPSHLPEVVAGLSCAFIVLVFITVFLVLQLRSGFSFRGVKVYTMDRGLISYKGLPPEAWQECPSDSEDDEGRGERTTFIRDQSVL